MTENLRFFSDLRIFHKMFFLVNNRVIKMPFNLKVWNIIFERQSERYVYSTIAKNLILNCSMTRNSWNITHLHHCFSTFFILCILMIFFLVDTESMALINHFSTEDLLGVLEHYGSVFKNIKNFTGKKQLCSY